MDLEQVAALADEYYSTRESRLELNREAKKLEEHEKELKDRLIELSRSNNSRVVGGELCSLERKTKQQPSAENWDLIREYIIEHDAWELMNRALNAKALRERAEEDELVPGVAWYPVDTLSIHKLK